MGGNDPFTLLPTLFHHKHAAVTVGSGVGAKNEHGMKVDGSFLLMGGDADYNMLCGNSWRSLIWNLSEATAF